MKVKKTCQNVVTISLSTPIGPLNISGCQEGMHFVDRVNKQLSSQPDLSIKCNMFNANNENLPKSVQQCVQWFDDYFSIDKTGVKALNPVVNGQHPLICPNLGLTEFSLKVYTKVASEVKFGSRTSYSGLADLVECPKASRAVGTALKKNPFTIIIPCHRVIPKSGGIGFYSGGADCAPLKEWLLRYEESVMLN